MNCFTTQPGGRALAAAALVWGSALLAQELPNGDFESEPFLTGWISAGSLVPFRGLAPGSNRAVKLASIGEARLGQNVSWGPDWHLDFHFAIDQTTHRALSLIINAGADAANAGSATVNLRYQGNQFNAYAAGSWGADLGLGAVAASRDANADGDFDDPGDLRNVYRMRVTGHDWGSASARYDLALSAANSTNLAVTVTGLTRWQHGSGVNGPPTSFLFSTLYGDNPGFWVDDLGAFSTNPPAPPEAILNISGTYPHLAVFSGAGEIGIGAVVPWANRLWFITYPPHFPTGSPDKLWMLDTNLVLTAHPQSVGGTHANRFIHRESQQLSIGPYFIDTNGGVRVVSPTVMPGRLTGAARHLTDPTNKIYLATMEEGLYEVDVNTLAVTELYHDMNASPGEDQRASGLPGSHGKGLYSAQGRLVYSNNGNGGALASWDGASWTTVERAKFTEVTGPGGLDGNPPGDDRLWAVGWDARSVILKLLQDGIWHTWRLPKGSYTHDADHGWFTEWPRIREISDGRMLMHMHGLFYNFPKTFSVANPGGLTPICTYLKMPVDYCWWHGWLVMGRDDASTTGGNRWAGQSHSAPWFGQLSDLEQWGAPAGFGGPWLEDEVVAGAPSDPFLLAGFQRRILHLKHSMGTSVNFVLQVDPTGSGTWTTVTNLAVPARGYRWQLFPPNLKAVWVRLVPERDAAGVTAYFHLANPPTAAAPELFAGIADAGQTRAYSDGIIRPREGDARTLQFAVNHCEADGRIERDFYEIDGAFQLHRATNPAAENTLRTTYGLANPDFSVDDASVVVIEGTNRFRLPKNHAAYDAAFPSGWPRGRREVVTERDLFQAHGTFYELPKSASGGFRRVRPVATHNRHISDFASWRGLFAIAGVASTGTNAGHVFRSGDGRAALWFGNVDDLWRFGAPAGVGGPWKNTAVLAGVPSDPYLIFGYECKVLELSHTAAQPVTVTVEVDFAANNTWGEYARFTVPPGQIVKHLFPEGYSAHWVRLKTDADATLSATFTCGPAGPQMESAHRLPDGSMRLSFRGVTGRSYTVRATTNLLSPLASWPAIESGAFEAGLATYDDLAATNWLQRFYVISMP